MSARTDATAGTTPLPTTCYGAKIIQRSLRAKSENLLAGGGASRWLLRVGQALSAGCPKIAAGKDIAQGQARSRIARTTKMRMHAPMNPAIR
jgi:hypothetical protein